MHSEIKGQKLRDLVTYFTEDYSRELDLLPRTVVGKKETLNRMLKFLGNKPFNLETSREYLSHLAKKGWKPNSRRCEGKVIRSFANFLFKREYIAHSWADRLELPKVRTKAFEYLSPEIVEKIIIEGTKPNPSRPGHRGDNARNVYLKNETRLALQFIIRTGIRVTECIMLTGQDFNFYDDPPSFWVNSKGGDRDLMPIPIDMMEELQKRKEKDRLFEFRAATANLCLRRGAKALGIDTEIHVHKLRKIFASSLVKKRTSIQYVSKLLRHKDISITNRTYAHLDVSDIAAVMNGNLSLIKKGLNKTQIFGLLEDALEKSGIEDDERVKINVNKSPNNITISVDWVGE